jgi:SAM-dependent methyltransferase
MANEQLYGKFARYYDQIYQQKDYQKEVKFIRWAIEEHKRSRGIELLDMACGTGSHAKLLKDQYQILGVDLNPEMLEIASPKVPGVDFAEGNMKTLDLERKFDVAICMFSAIHYNTNYHELEETLINFHNHLKEGGVLIFDLFFNTDNWIEGLVSVDTVVEEGLKLARFGQSSFHNGIYHLNFVFLVKVNEELDFEIDQHEIGVFELEKVNQLMEKIGFKTIIYDDFTSKRWESGEGESPIFVGVK